MIYHAVIDIRTPEEWKDGAFETYFPDENIKLIEWAGDTGPFEREFATYPNKSLVLLVCRSNHRVQELIKAIGDTRVTIVQQFGGYEKLKGKMPEITKVEEIPEDCLLLLGMEGCGPCAKAKDKLADRAIFVNCTRNLEIARHFNAADMPTVIKIENGEETNRWHGRFNLDDV